MPRHSFRLLAALAFDSFPPICAINVKRRRGTIWPRTRMQSGGISSRPGDGPVGYARRNARRQQTGCSRQCVESNLFYISRQFYVLFSRTPANHFASEDKTEKTNSRTVFTAVVGRSTRARRARAPHSKQAALPIVKAAAAAEMGPP